MKVEFMVNDIHISVTTPQEQQLVGEELTSTFPAKVSYNSGVCQACNHEVGVGEGIECWCICHGWTSRNGQMRVLDYPNQRRVVQQLLRQAAESAQQKLED